MNGIYIHIPFCKAKCKYCDFHSFSNHENEFSAYTEEIINEISQLKERAEDRLFETVYIGGGTPSLLPLFYLEKIIDAVFKNFHLELKEFTIEQNPESADNFKLLKSFGINRLSFGVQSLNDNTLKAIGRLHDKSLALSKINEAKVYFNNISADLILGLPYEKEKEVLKNIEILAPLVEHISAYMLTLCENTPLYKEIHEGKFKIADSDELADIYICAADALEKAGLIQYEISNFCKKGYSSIHNQIYWNGGEYLGIGANASSYFSSVRYKNPYLFEYLQGMHSGNLKQIIEEELSEEEKISEKIMLSLRTVKGLDTSEKIFSEVSEKLEKILSDIYIKYKEFSKFNNGIFNLNLKGFLISNIIISDILALFKKVC